jgi:hypothetical protein
VTDLGLVAERIAKLANRIEQHMDSHGDDARFTAQMVVTDALRDLGDIFQEEGARLQRELGNQPRVRMCLPGEG